MLDHGWTMLFSGIFMWAFWFLLIVLMIIGFKFLSGPPKDDLKKDLLLKKLKKRFAHGEIDKQDFERRRKDL